MGWAVKPSLLGFVLLASLPSTALGQTADIKRLLPEPTPPLCPPVAPVSVSPTAADRAEADRLLARGTQLTLLGDAGAAVDLLRQAEGLNPASPDVAYRLGQAERDLGRGSDAAVYYCRYLALSPGAEDGDDVRALVAQLVPPPQPLYGPAGANRFHDGVDAWDSGDVGRAQDAFLDVVEMAPNLAEAVYNRGVVAAYQGRTAAAAADLARYVELQPTAEDRDFVEDWTAYLVSPVEFRSPAGALAGGLVVPGLGQLMTGSQVGGYSLLAAGGLAAGVGLFFKTVNVQCLGPPVNGECPDGQIKSRARTVSSWCRGWWRMAAWP